MDRLDRLDPESWDFSGADTQYLLHNLHPYPARFIPQIPRRAIERWTAPGQLVLDPFCGSGTALLECALLGRNSVGVDNNGVATLVASAKVAVYNESDLHALEQLADGSRKEIPHAGRQRKLDDIVPTTPDYPYRDKWFDKAASKELGWLRSRLETLEDPSRLLARAVFSSIIVQVSRQDSDTRYAAVQRAFTPGMAVERWIRKTKIAVRRARDTMHLRKPSDHEVHTTDARRIPFVPDGCVSLIVTSPPYLNAYDYHKYHRHRLHWIGADVELARDLEIGKHDVFTRPGAKPDQYFADLRTCMSEWVRVLHPGGRTLVVIGDAIVNGQFVPVGDRLVELAAECGLDLETRWVRRVEATRKSFNLGARIKREHLLLFRSIG